MIFESKNFHAALVEENDLNEILEVYNSNEGFLLNHLNTDRVTEKWMIEELASMREIGFQSCKIVERESGRIMGIMDFKGGEETYLSLLIIHRDFKGKGLGRAIFQAFEMFLKSLKSKGIRIDVVINYDDSVLDFWVGNGFAKYDDVELNWDGRILPAVIMKKYLSGSV